MRGYSNKKDNPYYQTDNFENSFDSFLPIQYTKIGSGESNPKTGEFTDVPDSYDSYDVSWINNLIFPSSKMIDKEDFFESKKKNYL